MNSFIKKYKYILFFVLIIIISSYVCICNYRTIEAYADPTNSQLVECDVNSRLPPLNAVNLQKTSSGGDNPIDYYHCKDSNKSYLSFYIARSLPELSSNNILDYKPIDISYANSYDDKIRACLEKAHLYNYDIFGISGDKCTILDIKNNNPELSYTNDDQIYTYCSDSSQSDVYLNNYRSPNQMNMFTTIGTGGFTSKGNSKFNNNIFRDLVVDYNPLCDLQIASKQLSDELSSCLSNSSGEACTSIINDLSAVQQLILSKSGSPQFLDTLSNGNKCHTDTAECIVQSFDVADTILHNNYNLFYENSANVISDASFDDFSGNLIDYKLSLAQQEESKLNSKSLFSKYIFLLLIVIITIIMVILNVTNSDIVTAEILISYIIFLVLVIFVTSNYFNVDYGPLNKFLMLDLGSAGNRNIFKTPGYKP